MRITYGKAYRILQKQLEEQKLQLQLKFNQLETQLKQAKNSYMKVEGAQEIIAIQIKEEQAKAAVEAVVPEASGD